MGNFAWGPLNVKKWNISPVVFIVSCVVTFLIRVYLAHFGYNFDLDSFRIVADLMQQGKNVYINTDRYNYAPVWMWILYFIKLVSFSHFRYAVAAFISLVDVAIAIVLYKRGNKLASLLILYSPVCAIISGYHNQFDNLAILIGLLAVRYAETRKNYAPKGLSGLSMKEIVIFALLLGISISTKHVLIFFPFWFLFMSGLKFQQRLVLVFLPIVLFFRILPPLFKCTA